ncbi:hypothetical protein VKT23_011942 [Stygiomarasmius scandens]|uniref:Uncharacterized protein n=1 Tax=Marasmiellus scandens TaxID=2682957 RepID=A0ABR1JA20_9AGAR
MGPVATSTRDMGPGSRHDTMDNHWGHWNWVKLVLKEFTEQQGDVTSVWEKMVRDWEGDMALHPDEQKKKNPYKVPNAGLMESEVRLQLLSEEAEQEKAGMPVVHNVSPASFISQGLELEEQQRHLKLDLAKNKFDTMNQRVTLLQRWTKLLHVIGRFRSMQATYMPAALQLIEKSDPKQEHAEQIHLLLPSELSTAHCTQGCHQGLPELERKLREAQLWNSLNQL